MAADISTASPGRPIWAKAEVGHAGAADQGARLALVDADRASNLINWQWVAGSGPDATPFFRIYNPVAQGEKFDAEGRYVRMWLPELAGLPNRWLHAPWTAPEAVLAGAGVRLGVDYPAPIVDHAQARARALAALKSLPKAHSDD